MTRLVPILPATTDAALTPRKDVPWPWEIEGASDWDTEELAAYYRQGWAQCQVREVALQDDIRDARSRAAEIGE